MITPNEFWLALHVLSEAFDAEGQTPDERLANIMGQFRRMPPTVRRSLLLELERLNLHANDLLVAARAICADEVARPLRERAG